MRKTYSLFNVSIILCIMVIFTGCTKAKERIGMSADIDSG